MQDKDEIIDCPDNISKHDNNVHHNIAWVNNLKTPNVVT